MTDAASPDPPIIARLTVQTGYAGMRGGSLIGVFLVRASSAELDALVQEIKSHDYWARADPLAEDHKTSSTEILGLNTPAVEVSPDDVRRELYWLFED